LTLKKLGHPCGHPWLVCDSTGELPKCKQAEHLKNVFSLHFSENLFLGALLAFLCSMYEKEKKKGRREM
jgi:hypothetical protein